MNKFHLKVEESGKRLDLYLAQRLSLTRTRVKRLIEEGHVYIPGRVVKPSLILKEGLEIFLEIPKEEPLIFEAEEIPLNVLFEDPYLLAVNKPPNMVVHPALGHKRGTLLNALLYYLKLNSTENPRIGIVHRLDKDTSGVILLAKDQKIQEELSFLFKSRQIKKVYRAIVHGIIRKEEGEIETLIGRHKKDRKKMSVVKEGGRYAKTGYRVIRYLKDFTYLEVYPETGRTHQIRVHLSHIGHPVVGDSLYGRKDKIAKRPLLHALSLSFVHPVKMTLLEIVAPVPEDMEEFLERFRL